MVVAPAEGGCPCIFSTFIGLVEYRKSRSPLRTEFVENVSTMGVSLGGPEQTKAEAASQRPPRLPPRLTPVSPSFEYDPLSATSADGRTNLLSSSARQLRNTTPSTALFPVSRSDATADELGSSDNSLQGPPTELSASCAPSITSTQAVEGTPRLPRGPVRGQAGPFFYCRPSGP